MAYSTGTQYTRQSLNETQETWLHRQQVIGCEAMYAVFHSNFAACIVCRCYKPCEFLWFVWTDCWGNKSNYVITSPAKNADTQYIRDKFWMKNNIHGFTDKNLLLSVQIPYVYQRLVWNKQNTFCTLKCSIIFPNYIWSVKYWSGTITIVTPWGQYYI